MIKHLTLDSNIFISSIKRNEEYSDKCREIIDKVGKDFILVEPAILITEVGNAVGRNINIETAKMEVEAIIEMVTIFQNCDTSFCNRAGLTGAKYNIYSADSIFLQTALDYDSILITLDEDDFLKRVKAVRAKVDVVHPREFSVWCDKMNESIYKKEIIQEIENIPNDSLPKVLKLIHFFKEEILTEKKKERGSLKGIWGNIEIEDEIFLDAKKSLFKMQAYHEG